MPSKVYHCDLFQKKRKAKMKNESLCTAANQKVLYFPTFAYLKNEYTGFGAVINVIASQ